MLKKRFFQHFSNFSVFFFSKIPLVLNTFTVSLVFEPNEIEMILARLVLVAQESRITFLWRPNLHDEGDNYLVEIAVAMQPCTLVTHNIKDFQQAELLFPHVIVKRPQQVLQERIHE